MDPRDLLSHASARYILVFFENTMANFNREPSLARRKWFEDFREYLGVNPLGYKNSKESGDYSEEIIFVQLKYLESSTKNWLIDCALEMIASEDDFDLSDVRITAARISRALDIPESDFYDIMDSKTRKLKKESRKIYYSKFKTTSLFYNSGQHIIELFEDDTFAITSPKGKTYSFEIISVQQEHNDSYMMLKNARTGALGYFKMMPMGKAEFKFDTGNAVKLKI